MKKAIKRPIILIILAHCFYQPLFAQLNTDRPSQSDNSYTLKPGSFQHENGFQINAVENTPAKVNYTGTLPYSLFRLGLIKGFELRMATAILRDPENAPSPFGLADVELGTKIQILKNVAWISHLGLPTGNSKFSNGKLFSAHKVSATIGSERSAFIFNSGVRFSTNPVTNQREQIWLTTSVGSRNINKSTSVFGEVFISQNALGKGANRITTWQPGFDVGFASKLSDNSQIDFSYGYIKDAPFVNLGFSWGAFTKKNLKRRRLITPDF